MHKATLYSLGPTNSPSTFTGWRDFRIEGRGFIVIAAAHLDFADDRGEAALAAALAQVLTSAEAVAATGDPNIVLQSMHSAARGTGRYFSAAVIHVDDNASVVSRCGLASVSTTNPPEAVLRAELLTESLTVLSNALGVRTFHMPLETGTIQASMPAVIAVGGTVDPADLTLGERLLPVTSAERSRGGIALRLD